MFKEFQHWRHQYIGLSRGVLLLVLIFVLGTVGYHRLGAPEATWVNSFYMTFITITTIGYTEVVDLSHRPLGRLFNVFIAFMGIATMSYLPTRTVALLVDADLNAGFRRRRMEKRLAQMRGHYIVCGMGRVGSNVAHELDRTGRPFAVIEVNRAVIDGLLEHHPHLAYLHDDASDDAVLQRAGLSRAAGVFAVTSDDSHNLMIAMSVKLLYPKVRVVVRLHDIRNESKARRAGADEVVSPDFTGGMRIASAMVRPRVVDFMDRMLLSDDGLRVEEVTVPEGFPVTPLGHVCPPSRDYLVMALHEGDQWHFNPGLDEVIKPGVVVVFMAKAGVRQQVNERFQRQVA